MAAAQELIDNNIRGPTKVTYKSKVAVFAPTAPRWAPTQSPATPI